ncbi:hypothetical protein EV182_003891, partial [Spiromyces aspiralis]
LCSISHADRGMYNGYYVVTIIVMGGIFNFKQGEMSTFKSSQDSEYNKNPNSWLPI